MRHFRCFKDLFLCVFGFWGIRGNKVTQPCRFSRILGVMGCDFARRVGFRRVLDTYYIIFNWLWANQQLLQHFSFLPRVRLKINASNYFSGIATGGLGCTFLIFFFFSSFPIHSWAPLLNFKNRQPRPPAELIFNPIWPWIWPKGEVMRSKRWFSMKLKQLAERQQVQTTHCPKGRCASPIVDPEYIFLLFKTPVKRAHQRGGQPRIKTDGASQ